MRGPSGGGTLAQGQDREESLPALSLKALSQNPASLLYLNAQDPLLLQLEMLRLLDLGYEAPHIRHAFGLDPDTDLHGMLAQVKAEGASTLAARRRKARQDGPNSIWGEDTMGQICAVAVRVFHERGYHGATMRDIARAVGIRAPSIYNHFPTKETLLHHVMMQTLSALRKQVNDALDEHPADPISQISTFIREHIRFHLEYTSEAAVADNELRNLSEENRALVMAQRDDYEAILQKILEQGWEQGVFKEQESKLIKIAILTMCTTVASWYQPTGLLSPKEIAKAYTRFVLRMVGCA